MKNSELVGFVEIKLEEAYFRNVLSTMRIEGCVEME